MVLSLLLDITDPFSVSLLILTFFPLKVILFFPLEFKFIWDNFIIFCWSVRAVCNKKGFILEYCMNNKGLITCFDLETLLGILYIGKRKGENDWEGNAWGFIWLIVFCCFWIFSSIFWSSLVGIISFRGFLSEFHMLFLNKSDSLKLLLVLRRFGSFCSWKLLFTSKSLKKSNFLGLLSEDISSKFILSLL